MLFPPIAERRVGMDASQAIAVQLHAGKQAIRRRQGNMGSSRNSNLQRATPELTCDDSDI
jgi:hypothetical protein